ncbi:MAG: hypothetical protein ACHP79_08245 [Terriglobales bacterium]
MADQAARPLRAAEARPLWVRLLGGLVVYLSTLYCGSKLRTGRGRGSEGSGLYPELAVLGFSKGSSPALASRVGRLTALLPSYEVARGELAEEGVFLDIKQVHGISKHLGAEVLATRRRDLERYRAGELPRGHALRGKRVGVAIDGGRVRTRVVVRKQKGKGKGKKQRRKMRVQWREPKLLIIFELDEQGRMKRGTRPWIDGTLLGPDECMELLAMHLHRLGAEEAKLVVFLSDGAPWIWERLAWVETRVGLRPEQVVRVLDCCHAVHHVSLALEKLPLSEQKRKQLYRELRKKLRAGRAYEVTIELSLLAENLPLNSPVWTEIHFLEKHAEAGHLWYRAFRRRGVPLGSGAIESAVRRVVNLRLKGNGIMWYEQNAEGMLALRAAALTGRWQETLHHVRETMARDRRLDWQWTSPNMPAELKAGVSTGPPSPQPQATTHITSTAA